MTERRGGAALGDRALQGKKGHHREYGRLSLTPKLHPSLQGPCSAPDFSLSGLVPGQEPGWAQLEQPSKIGVGYGHLLPNKPNKCLWERGQGVA